MLGGYGRKRDNVSEFGSCEYYISLKPTFWRAWLSMLNFRLLVPSKKANHRCCCRYAAESSSANKRQSQQGTCLAKVEPRAPRHERRRVAVADVAEKIRFHMSFRENSFSQDSYLLAAKNSSSLPGSKSLSGACKF